MATAYDYGRKAYDTGSRLLDEAGNFIDDLVPDEVEEAANHPLDAVMDIGRGAVRLGAGLVGGDDPYAEHADVDPDSAANVARATLAGNTARAAQPDGGMHLPDVGAMMDSGFRSLGDMARNYGANAEEPVATRTLPDAPSATRIRAVRMPDGKVVFTNQGDAEQTKGSQLLSEGEGADEWRLGMVDEARESGYLQDPPPATSTNSQMLTAAIQRSAERRQGGGFSSVEGTDEIKARLEEEKILRSLGIADANQRLEIASMSPQEAMALKNPDLQMAKWHSLENGPKLAGIEKLRASKIRSFSDPANAKTYIKDPDERARAIRQENSDADAAVQQIMDRMAIDVGRPVSPLR